MSKLRMGDLVLWHGVRHTVGAIEHAIAGSVHELDWSIVSGRATLVQLLNEFGRTYVPGYQIEPVAEDHEAIGRWADDGGPAFED